MTALALRSVPVPSSLHRAFALNWPRVAAYSGSFSLHLLLALMLLVPPLAMQVQRIVQEKRIDAVFIEPPRSQTRAADAKAAGQDQAHRNRAAEAADHDHRADSESAARAATGSGRFDRAAVGRARASGACGAWRG